MWQQGKVCPRTGLEGLDEEYRCSSILFLTSALNGPFWTGAENGASVWFSLYFFLHPYAVVCLDCAAFCLCLQYIGIHAPGGSRACNPNKQTAADTRLATGLGRIRSPGRPARSESLYRLSYPGPPFLIV